MVEGELGVIVVGTSYGVLAHVGALRDAGFDVVALVGRDARKAQSRAESLGVPYGLNDLGQALNLDGIGVVTVATPPHTHAEISLAAVAAGKHVLCEKPFALDLDQARQVLAAANAAGVVHLMGHEHRFRPSQETLRRVVRSGTIGRPRKAVILRHWASLVDPSVELPGWWESAAEGGGWLGALGSHTIDQIRTTLGEFEAVSATVETLAPRPAMTSDDTYTIQFRLTNGCTGILHSSCAVAGPPSPITKVSGTSGAAWTENDTVWADTGKGPKRVPDPDDMPHLPPEPPAPEFLPPYAIHTGWHTSGLDRIMYGRLYRQLHARVHGISIGDDPPAATFADGAATQAVLDGYPSLVGERRLLDPRPESLTLSGLSKSPQRQVGPRVSWGAESVAAVRCEGRPVPRRRAW
jgi:predicted dehydrogenase